MLVPTVRIPSPCRYHFFNRSRSRGRALFLQKNKRRATPDERRKELEERMSKIVEEKRILEDVELTDLWKEMTDVLESRKTTEKEKDMTELLTKLFDRLSRKPKHKFVSEEQIEEVFKDLPPVVTQSFKDLGLWDRLPNAGFEAEAIDNLQLWTEEEAEVFNEDPNLPPPIDEEEEIRKEKILIRAVKKLEDFLQSYPEDPAEVLNIMMSSKMALEADRNPLPNPMDTQIDDVDEDVDEDFEDVIDVEGIEACLQALEEGEDAPHPDPEQVTVLPADTTEAFRKKMELMHNYFQDPSRKPKDRVLTPEEYKAIQQRWDEFMPKEEPIHFKEIDHVRLAPDWPEWMERHFRSLQHIVYILRAAHINAKLTEPGRRLEKYDRIAHDVVFKDPAMEIRGYGEYMKLMEKMEKIGFTTEPSLIFADCQPPEKQYLDDPEKENPWDYIVVVDQYLNMPIPDWYHAKLDEYEATLTEEDRTQTNDDFLDLERYNQMENIDQVLKKKEKKESKPSKQKKKPKVKTKRRNEEVEKQLDELNVGVKSGDPSLYEPFYGTEKTKTPQRKEKPSSLKGDFWYEGSVNEAWKDGYMITISATLLYKLDISSGKVCDIQMRWGTLVGSFLESKDVERIYCEWVGVEYESRRYKHDFASEWKEYEYKPIRNNPVEWFKTQVLGME